MSCDSPCLSKLRLELRELVGDRSWPDARLTRAKAMRTESVLLRLAFRWTGSYFLTGVLLSRAERPVKVSPTFPPQPRDDDLPSASISNGICWSNQTNSDTKFSAAVSSLSTNVSCTSLYASNPSASE